MKLEISISAATNKIKQRDTKILQALAKWMFKPAVSATTGRDAGTAAMLKIQKLIPPKYRIAPTKLYRALILTPKLKNELVTRYGEAKSSKDVILTLKPYKLSSFTTSLAFARRFGMYYLGAADSKTKKLIIIRKNIAKNQVLLNLPLFAKDCSLSHEEMLKLLGRKGERFLAWFEKEKEIIVINDADTREIRRADVVEFAGKDISKTVRGKVDSKSSSGFFSEFKKSMSSIGAEVYKSGGVKEPRYHAVAGDALNKKFSISFERAGAGWKGSFSIVKKYRVISSTDKSFRVDDFAGMTKLVDTALKSWNKL